MTGESGENQGLPEAHTPGENFGGGGSAAGAVDQERAAKVGTVKAMAAQAIEDLARDLVEGGEEAEQQSLMLDEMDEQMALFRGPVRHVADQIERARKGPGRPKGSQNKASREFADIMQRMGYRHSGLNLAAVANADAAALAIELGVLPEPPEGFDPYAWLLDLVQNKVIERSFAAAMMDKAYTHLLRANAELLPYFESKAPTKVNVDKREVRGVMIIGDMAQPVQSERSTIDLTKFDAPT
ncbi:hypothetical protein J5N58_01260 [Rhizobium cremeum]|uniref:hypothetical protein n=1 Tax=Rhizobium cremeum TaxID=2813827 RepID=UPI001FD16401|nr:hypothetical protein [Rhizobium cremeum]MCJ7993225.1 hypothetical protein [Rhizobium cremeum]MCJ7998290.1 hypothetical protein [Rhizobium cremeum]